MSTPVSPSKKAEVEQLYADHLVKLKSLVAKRTQRLTSTLKQVEATQIERVKKEIDQTN